MPSKILLYSDYTKTILKYRISNVYLSYMYRICIELNSGINAVLWRVCYGFAMGLLWDCYGIATGLFYVGHIVAADAFPSAVVEEGDVVAIDTAKLVAVRVASVPP